MLKAFTATWVSPEVEICAWGLYICPTLPNPSFPVLPIHLSIYHLSIIYIRREVLVAYGKESACNLGNTDLIPGLRKSPGGGHDNPLQYSCLENPMYRGGWRATVYRGHKELDTTE